VLKPTRSPLEHTPSEFLSISLWCAQVTCALEHTLWRSNLWKCAAPPLIIRRQCAYYLCKHTSLHLINSFARECAENSGFQHVANPARGERTFACMHAVSACVLYANLQSRETMLVFVFIYHRAAGRTCATYPCQRLSAGSINSTSTREKQAFGSRSLSRKRKLPALSTNLFRINSLSGLLSALHRQRFCSWT
jgi:hypothetical protein